MAEVIGAVSALASLIQISGEVLKAGYSFLAKVARAPLEIRSMLNEVAGLDLLVDQLYVLATKDDESLKNGALAHMLSIGVFDDCDELLQTVQRSVQKCEQVAGHDKLNLGKRLIWPFREHEARDSIERLQRLRTTLSMALTIDSV